MEGEEQVIVESTTLMVLNGGRRKPSNRKVAYKHACFMRKQEVGGARSKRAIPAHAFYFFFSRDKHGLL